MRRCARTKKRQFVSVCIAGYYGVFTADLLFSAERERERGKAVVAFFSLRECVCVRVCVYVNYILAPRLILTN